MRPPVLLLALWLAGGCDLVPERLIEQGYDPDGDGVPWPEDCDSTSAARFPGAVEIWYDGIDGDCGQDDDYDHDGDGWVPSAYAGLPTAGVEGSGALPGGDCWDDPGTQENAHTVIPDTLSDAAGQPLAWDQPAAAEVNPGAPETWYDGVDGNCDGLSDLDQDGDGWATAAYPDRGGEFGEDCIDGAPLDAQNPAGIAADEANPGAGETWYDGTDQDCDGASDFDADGDGFEAAATGGDDCDDEAFEVTPDATEIWYDGVDQDCDGNDGDQDGDGFWASDYEARVAAAGGEPLPIPVGMDGDCWDVPLGVEPAPADFEALNGYAQPDAAETFPGAVDPWYDGIDQDCGGDDDFDQDQDGAASDTVPNRDSEVGGDCDDQDPGVNPWALELWYDGRDPDCDENDGDQDGDGYWATDYEARVLDAGGTPLTVPSGAEGDCDDLDSTVHPGTAEWCDGLDQDCDGLTDDEAVDALTWYADADGDGYGDSASRAVLCTPPSGAVADASDCDDTRALVNPGALEVCDGLDDDCDGLTDLRDPTVADALTWYSDDDDDGHGDAADPGELWCLGDEPAGWLLSGDDCDDTDAAISPAAIEVCDHVDDDCDGVVDEADAAGVGTWYSDADGDGWGDPSTGITACWQPTGFVTDATDCDDAAGSSHPGAAERVADGVDQDCDGRELCLQDGDGDGWGAGVVITSADLDCGGAGESWDNADCDDAAAAIFPGAAEGVADGVDQDCDGLELCFRDADGDGFGVTATASSAELSCTAAGSAPNDADCDDGQAGIFPGAVEVVADGVDQDCDAAEICYRDLDADGFGSAATLVGATLGCSGSGESALGTDCDDADTAVNPGAVELCDGLDGDCDGEVDGPSAIDAAVWYADTDADGFGDAATTTVACAAPSGFVSDATDCDDADPGVSPGAVELCGNGVDDDCDGTGAGCTPLGAVDLARSDARLLGIHSGAQAGWAVAGAGDVDHDGFADLAVGAPGEGGGAGSVYLVLGPVDGDLDLGSADVTFRGEGSGDGAGCAVGARYDEGILLVGAEGSDLSGLDAGAAYFAVIGGYGDYSLNYADTRLQGEAAGDAAGAGVADLGDLTGDGQSEVLVGAYGNDAAGSDAGAAYLVDGGTYGDFGLGGSTACLRGEAPGDRAGMAVAGAGDVDGDGVGDLLVGAPWHDTDAGAAYLLFAPPSGEFSLADADARLLGAAGDQAGVSLASAGDLDGDGRDDLAVGAPGSDTAGTDAGLVYLVLGVPSGDVALATSADARLLGVVTGDAAGRSVAGGGDVDGDGTPDLIVGAPHASGSVASAGVAYLLLGPGPGDSDLSDADAILGGEYAGDLAGWSVAQPGDVDADGWDDLFVGAAASDLSDADAGTAYLLLGGGM